MSLVVIFGPPAVGKMTVGFELQHLTGFAVLHNHLAIEPVLPFFPFGTPPFHRLVQEFRRRILEEVAESDQAGLTFTYVWALDQPADKTYVDTTTAIFSSRGRPVHFVELTASLDERLRRNETPLRLEHKPSKRDIAGSRTRLREHEAQHQFNTEGSFPYPDRHLKIDNTTVDPRKVAERIVNHFGLPRIGTTRGEA